MANETTTINLPLMVEILEDLRVQHVMECKFEKRMRETQTSMRWNPNGIISPYNSAQDYNHFGMSEAGVLQSGGTNEYVNTKQTMRQLWKTVNITGELERLKAQEFVSLKEEYGQEIPDQNALAGLAANNAIEYLLKQAGQVFGRLKNFYAINGGDSSAIATVTGGSSVNLEFRWDTTDQGNRMLKKGMKVQFYDTSLGQLRRNSANYASARTESEQYSVVANLVDPRASVNAANNGLVVFDVVPVNNNAGAANALAAGDTVHTLQGYGTMPQGFLYWVSDTGALNGESGSITRSDYPEIFIPVVQNNAPSTANSPLLMAKMESYLRGATSDNEPINTEIWMNKAQTFNYIKFGLNSAGGDGNAFNVQRWHDLTAPDKVDVGVPHGGLSFNNLRIEEDVDVPPSKILWIDWLGWMVDVETPETIYEYHQNQQFYQAHNSYGEPIDAKQATLFTQYNYRCTKFKTQGFQEDLAYDADQVARV